MRHPWQDFLKYLAQKRPRQLIAIYRETPVDSYNLYRARGSVYVTCYIYNGLGFNIYDPIQPTP